MVSVRAWRPPMAARFSPAAAPKGARVSLFEAKGISLDFRRTVHVASRWLRRYLHRRNHQCPSANSRRLSLIGSRIAQPRPANGSNQPHAVAAIAPFRRSPSSLTGLPT